jgi:cell division FtsZ-interacting protein ZapD
MILYELPPNDAVKFCLKFNTLYEELKSEHHVGTPRPMPLIRTMNSLIQVIDRSDIKPKLTRLLKQFAKMDCTISGYANFTESNFKQNLQQLITTFDSFNETYADKLLDDQFIKMLYKHSNIPGGICPIQTPAFNLWLNMHPKAYANVLKNVLAVLEPLHHATTLITYILRTFGAFQQHTITDMTFSSQQPTSKQTLQLIRIQTPEGIYPVLSCLSNKFHIQFVPWDLNKEQQNIYPTLHKPQTIEIKIACCYL